jgi:hypothetical protein
MTFAQVRWQAPQNSDYPFVSNLPGFIILPFAKSRAFIDLMCVSPGP